MQKCQVWSFNAEIDYDIGLSLQKRALNRITTFEDFDCLIMLRHRPVITKGNSSKEEHILKTNEFLREKGVEVYDTDRGGNVTYHGPGQLVGYPIIDLRRKHIHLKDYKPRLCKTLIDTLKEYGIEAEEGHGKLSGIWVGDKKIAAIGYAVKKVYGEENTKIITAHGFALYVLDEMENFRYINPCGVPDMKLTSIEQALKRKVEFGELKERYAKNFARVFEYEIIQ